MSQMIQSPNLRRSVRLLEGSTRDAHRLLLLVVDPLNLKILKRKRRVLSRHPHLKTVLRPPKFRR